MSDYFDRISKLSPKRLMLLAADLHAELEEIERRAREPFAIVGIGCRFPGRVRDPQAFWELLRDEIDPVSEVPATRWDVNAYYDADPRKAGTTSTRYMGWVADIDRFDPAFFGISPREAVSMDPQHRLLLEVAWEAIEHAGYAPDSLAGSATGVFVGTGNNEYAQLGLRSYGLEGIDAYLSTGNTASAAAGRISYVLGLQGPSLAVDTACSSSLMAVHLACQSLRSGECRMAIAGGVNVIVSPTSTIALSALHMLSPDGRCKTFDASANGFVRGEGCGLIVLKRLADADADGDRVWAVIRGTAVNQDGRSSGMTAPNGPAQQAVIRRALGAAGVEPSAVQYVETHGTGTTLGDPIEVQALGAVLGEARSAATPVIIGSVKSNVGHLEAAAGVAGLIKVVLAMAHGEIPAQLHFSTPNPYIDWPSLPVQVARTRQKWPAAAGERLAGVSSFGASGTNVHVVVADRAQELREESQASGQPRLLLLSAKTAPALRDVTNCMREYLASLDAGTSWADVCFTAAVGRTHWQHRYAVIARSASDAAAQLTAYLAGRPAASIIEETSDAGAVTSAESLRSLADAYVRGESLDWPHVNGGGRGRRVPLPTYPFQRERYWIVDTPAAPKPALPDVTSWQYQVEWKQESLSQTPARASAGKWLILSDRQGIGEALAARIGEHAGTCELLFREQVDLTAPGAFENVIAERIQGSTTVLHLWALDRPESDTTSVESIAAAQQYGTESVLRLVHALMSAKLTQLPRLWLATRHTQSAASGSRIDVEHAPMTGLAKVIAREHPELWGGSIDVDDGASVDHAAMLFEEVSADAREDQVAFRDRRRFVARLTRLGAGEDRSSVPAVTADATYLITGGTGALGLHVARALVQQGARHVVLMARSEPSSDVRSSMAEIETLGARVEAIRGDVADRADVSRVLAAISTRMPQLRGVVHTAGVLDDGVLLQQTPERFRAVMAPKVAGTWNLHELAPAGLDFFVLFSSSASVFGSAAQGNYAAANAFLDAVAHHRLRNGERAISINWGPWGEKGMAASVATQSERRWAAQGIGTMTPSEGVRVLEQLLGREQVAQAVVLPIDWTRLAGQFETFGVPPLFLELAADAQAAPSRRDKSAPPSKLLSRLEQAHPGERDRLMTGFVQGEVAAVMGFAANQLPEIDAGFFQMGMDSLMAVELKNRLQAGLARTLPSTVAFEYPSVRALSGYLLAVVHEREIADTLAAAPELDSVTANLVAEVRELSDERMAAYIAEELDALST